MRYPALVKPAVCTTPIRLVVYGETLDADGAPTVAGSFEGRCFWQDSGRVERTDEQQYVRIAGRAFFPGDVLPAVPVIAAGYAEVFGERRSVVSGRKARDPDGRVNYTEVRFA